ncbi:MAG: NfeD family protein [Planctomycetota bacterium]
MGPLGWVLLLFLLGMVAIFLEVITPGGVVGMLGVFFLSTGVVVAFSQLGLRGGWVALAAAVVIGPVSFLLGMKIIPDSPLGKVLRLHKELNAAEGYVASERGLEELVGKTGVAATSLRPAGLALIDGKRVDVVTSGFMIAKGVDVRVVQVDGNRVVVEEIAKGEA